jgi:uncharacterized paraquat-inducible protein A
MGKLKIARILLLMGSIIFYILGMVYPIMATKYKLVGISLKSSEVNLLDSVKIFYESGDFLIAVIILVFTIVFPVLKYVELAMDIVFGRQLRHSADLDKWNMLDVFIVAMLLLNFKMNSSFIVMELRLGTTFLAFSVILRIFLGFIQRGVLNYKK